MARHRLPQKSDDPVLVTSAAPIMKQPWTVEQELAGQTRDGSRWSGSSPARPHAPIDVRRSRRRGISGQLALTPHRSSRLRNGVPCVDARRQ